MNYDFFLNNNCILVYKNNRNGTSTFKLETLTCYRLIYTPTKLNYTVINFYFFLFTASKLLHLFL